MTSKAQRDYYTMPAARDVLEARVAAIADVIPKGSVIIDLGCNDGSISNGLIENGAVSKSFGFDLEDIITHRRPEIVFETADLRRFDLANLPDADGVLILNVLHHLVRFSKDRAKEVVDTLLDRYGFVIADMGSFTETGEWGWRKLFDTFWKNDGEMWDFLFASAQWRFKLLRYPTQGKGHRTLWKLYKAPYALDDLEVTETFRRTPGSWPRSKQLIPIAEVGETKTAKTVQFSQARSRQGDRFWIKQYLSQSRDTRAALEMILANLAAAEMEFINTHTHAGLHVLRPFAVLPEGKIVFAFEPELFRATVVHFQDWTEFLEPAASKAGHLLATRRIELSTEFPKMSLMQACDFQLCTTWDGVTALDFEPNNWLTHVAHTGVLKVGNR